MLQRPEGCVVAGAFAFVSKPVAGFQIALLRRLNNRAFSQTLTTSLEILAYGFDPAHGATFAGASNFNIRSVVAS